VKSGKTAIIASVLMPAFTWLASGSLEDLGIEKCKVLQNRQVVLFPDVNAYRKWKTKAMELRGQCQLQPSSYLTNWSAWQQITTGKKVLTWAMCYSSVSQIDTV